jgi:hypothetical protein
MAILAHRLDRQGSTAEVSHGLDFPSATIPNPDLQSVVRRWGGLVCYHLAKDNAFTQLKSNEQVCWKSRGKG